MNLYKTKDFSSWAKDEGLKDTDLRSAFENLQNGGGNSLGGHVHKVRIALGSRGKSAGARTLIAYKQGNHGFFIYGFAKNQMANITEKEKKALKKLAKEYLDLTENDIAATVKAKKLLGVK